MTLDGIPETLPPVAETAERPHSVAGESRQAARRRTPPAVSDELLDRSGSDAEDNHVLDDLA